jgi:hypothetical protein
MPRLSIWFVRLSLIYLLGGFTLGGLMLAHKGLPFYPRLWNWLPVHMEFLLMGWFVHLALGVAFWILPRLSQGEPRGSEPAGWASLTILNLGLWLVVGQSLWHSIWLSLLGRLAEVSGIALLLGSLWRRVKPFGA